MSELELLRQIARLERRIGLLETGLPVPSISGWHSAIDETWTYASATTFTIAEDVTDRYQVGDAIRYKQGGAYKYGRVTNVTYSSPNSTITVFGDALTAATITDNWFSKILNPFGANLGHIDASWLGSAAAADGYVLTADGAGGAAWEAPGWIFGYWTSTSWDGDAKSASGIIDLSAVFGLPAGIKAIAVMIRGADTTQKIEFGLAKDSSNIYCGIMTQTPVYASSFYAWIAGIVPCDANGDVYFYCSAQIDVVYVYITGYCV